MSLNADTEWRWPVVWEQEERFWAPAPSALSNSSLHEVLAQCARSLLLLQSSDWPFMITTCDAADYGRKRFEGHAAETRLLLTILESSDSGSSVSEGVAFARELYERDALFPDIIRAIAWALESESPR
ncbi:MAG: DUF1957 domain-containing protein [Gemmatimonadaceae bacterium]